MSVQLISTAVMFLAGIMVGAVIDCIRYIISLLPKKSVVYKISFLIELACWLILGTITFYFLFILKGGEWRVVDPLAQIAGIIAYDLFFQPIFRFIGRMFTILIIKPVLFIVTFVFLIVRNIIHVFVRILNFLFRPITKFYKASKKWALTLRNK